MNSEASAVVHATSARIEAPRIRRGRSDLGVGLWVFIGVASALFSLFIAAYLLRMAAQDWASFGLPRQLWLSSALLAAASLAMELSARTSRAANWPQARSWQLAGGILAVAFLLSQLWAWQMLQDGGVLVSGNPAASFFYLLTAMHGLHLIGGLVGWTRAAQAAAPAGQHDPASAFSFDEQAAIDARATELARLCARYWHFLLAVWIVLYATFAGATPELVAWICAPLTGAAP